MARALRVVTRIAVSVMVIATVLTSVATPAGAHGERTQPSWARTMTATFFDVQYSGVRSRGQGADRELQVDVGEVLKLSGKVKISDQWPATLGDFEKGQIGVLMQGPVLLMRDMKVNGEFASGSIVMQPGDSFAFETELVGRRPGLYHIHPRIDLEGKGPIVGAGTWVRVRDTGEEFQYLVTLESGERVDMERYQTGTVYGYHVLWVGLGVVFCIGWLARKRLLSRLAAVQRGVSDRELISSRDRVYSAVVGAVTIALVVGAFVYASNQWSTIPVQVRQEAVPELEPPQLAEVDMQEARYDQQGHSLRLTVQLRNTTSSPIQVERLVVGPVTVAAETFHVRGKDDEMLGMQPDAALEPGTQRTVTFTVPTRQLERERVLATASTALEQLGAVLIVQDDDGRRSWVSVAGDLIKT